jgi:hypothetical protein
LQKDVFHVHDIKNDISGQGCWLEGTHFLRKNQKPLGLVIFGLLPFFEVG